jgi:hypothetical protein
MIAQEGEALELPIHRRFPARPEWWIQSRLQAGVPAPHAREAVRHNYSQDLYASRLGVPAS